MLNGYGSDRPFPAGSRFWRGTARPCVVRAGALCLDFMARTMPRSGDDPGVDRLYPDPPFAERKSEPARPPCAGPALAGRGPLPRGGKTVSAQTLAPLGPAASTDAGGRHPPGALMRRS